MTVRQKILKAFYPLFLKFSKWKGAENAILNNEQNIQPIESFYALNASTNTGLILSFSDWKGKKILIVNTASNCGYTAQYKELEKLNLQYADKLIVVAFPANDFNNQEKADDVSIRKFCQKNYGLSFPVIKKSKIIKGEGQHKVFQWLTDPSKNGWNEQQPSWNFSKYLINGEGVLTHYFAPFVSPLDNEIVMAILKE